MRFFSKFVFLIVLPFLTFSCSTPSPQQCCNNIPAPVHVTKPMFAKKGSSDKSPLEFFTDESGDFDPGRVQIVDMIGQNLLVRGNLPVIDKKFAYEELTQTIDKELHKKTGRDLSPNYLLIDISLLQLGSFSVEHDWFQEHPRFGCYWNRPIIGSLLEPFAFKRSERMAYLRLGPVEELDLFIEEIHSMVSRNCGRPAVIYVHCHSGQNRTGEVIACYRMRYLGMSYKDAVKANDELTGPIQEISQNAIKWYAFYLRDVKKVKSVGKIEGK